MADPRLILVGGFLGAGKTTLLWEAARRLAEAGHRTGLITNDQSPELVDTALLARSGAEVREVAGSCFCCDFDGLSGAVQSLLDSGSGIVIAEPVGSCTDLTATIMQPLMELRPDIRHSPLTVLVDPWRALEVLNRVPTAMNPNAHYILRMQMEEADVILLNKTDTLSAAERDSLLSGLAAAFAQSRVSGISALGCEGVDEWLEHVLECDEGGRRIAEVDYDRYAEGEAALGWLNAVVELAPAKAQTDFWGPSLRVLDGIYAALLDRGSEIGHIKAALEARAGQRSASLTRLGGPVRVPDYSPLRGRSARLLLNLRVQIAPAELETLTRQALNALTQEAVQFRIAGFSCISPGRPTPTYRYGGKV